MSAKIIQLRPHCDNWSLRLKNETRLHPPIPYPMPNECEWLQPDASSQVEVKYETTPTPPDS